MKIKKENIPGYINYASDAALEVAAWALEEKDRLKATKLKRIADKLEDKYRCSKEFKRKQKQNQRPGGFYTVLYSNVLWEIQDPPKPPPRPPVKKINEGEK